jgi:UDP-arabinose 4-epimerase
MSRAGRGKVLVTGGAGYIGSHACKALVRAGFVPVTYDNLEIGRRSAVRWGPLEEGDILDLDRLDAVMAAHRPLGLLHFAALSLVGDSMRAPGPYYRTNVLGTLCAIEACLRHGVGIFVLSSTCAIYGAPEKMPIGETTPPDPINPYGASKLMAERILADAGRAHGLRHVSLRYFNAAGADPDGEAGEDRPVETHLLPLALDAALGRRPALRVFGDDYPTPDGTAIRDYVHVADLATAHVRALEHLLAGGASARVNVGTGRGHSVREVLDGVARLIGRPVPHEVAPRRPGDPPVLVADPAEGRALLGDYLSELSSLERIIATAWAWRSR